MPVDSTITINDLEVNFNTHTVKLKGKEIELTPKEYELLYLFITNRGEVISREFIRKRYGEILKYIHGAES